MHLLIVARGGPFGDLGLDGLVQLVRREAEVAQDLRGPALLGADQAQQRVFRADPVVAEVGRRAACLLDGRGTA